MRDCVGCITVPSFDSKILCFPVKRLGSGVLTLLSGVLIFHVSGVVIVSRLHCGLKLHKEYLALIYFL